MVSRRKAEEQEEADRGHFAYDGLNRVMHEKARLGILTALRTRSEWILFGDLKELCSLTDGNLSRHLTVLHDAGLVSVRKGHEGSRPQTWARLTSKGRKEFDAYLEELHRVIQDANVRYPVTPDATGGDTPPGLRPA